MRNKCVRMSLSDTCKDVAAGMKGKAYFPLHYRLLICFAWQQEMK